MKQDPHNYIFFLIYWKKVERFYFLLDSAKIRIGKYIKGWKGYNLTLFLGIDPKIVGFVYTNFSIYIACVSGSSFSHSFPSIFSSIECKNPTHVGGF